MAKSNSDFLTKNGIPMFHTWETGYSSNECVFSTAKYSPCQRFNDKLSKTTVQFSFFFCVFHNVTAGRLHYAHFFRLSLPMSAQRPRGTIGT